LLVFLVGGGNAVTTGQLDNEMAGHGGSRRGEGLDTGEHGKSLGKWKTGAGPRGFPQSSGDRTSVNHGACAPMHIFGDSFFKGFGKSVVKFTNVKRSDLLYRFRQSNPGLGCEDLACTNGFRAMFDYMCSQKRLHESTYGSN
jgi:hypothetical protein